MVEVPEAPDQYAVDIANVVGVPDHPTFALVNMRSPELPADVLAVLRRLAYAPEGTAATHIPGFLARAIGAKVLEYAPEVAEPGAKLAKEADFLAFARSVMPDRHPDEVLKRARPTWDALGRAADTIEGARGWLTLLPVLRKQPVDLSLGGNDYSHQQVRRIAAMPLRFVLPHDHEATGARELSVELDSLYQTLDDLLADGYKKVGLFRNLGQTGLDLLARFASQQFPDRRPLPTLPVSA